MKALLQRADIRGFIAAIFLMGLLRFVLTTAGVADSTVKFFSMSVILLAGTIYFALHTETHKERLKASYLLFFPYMVVEVAALAYTWATGRQTIFHAAEYSFGTSIGLHTVGHLIGGLTWEPLIAFVIMEVVWLIAGLFSPKTGSGE
jgi:hypothetical protein